MILEEGSTSSAIGSLTVLYDAACPLCRHVRGWLERQWQLVPLEFVAAGSEQAEQRYPGLDHARTLREITVISDGGEVYEAAEAWVVCLWALKRHRAMSHRLSSPTGARFARGAVLTAARWREASKGASAARQGTKVPVRPTAQGRAGRTSPSTPVGPWTWSGRAWEPTGAPQPPAAAPCGEHCAAPPG